MQKKISTLFLSICMLFSMLVPIPIHAEEYSVNVTNLEVTPYVKEAKTATGTTLRNDVVATINNEGEPFNGWAKIYVGKEDAYVIQLEKQIASGNTTLTIPVTDTNEMLEPLETTTLQIEIYDNESCQKENLRSRYVNEEWQRTRHWEFYLSQTMHTDLGYTLYQEGLKDLFSGFLDTVKEYMKNSDDRGDIEKYLYAIESGFVMGEGYMTRRNADEIQELLDLMGEDRMNIGAGRFNYVMEAFTPEETARAAYYTNRYLKDTLGIKPSKLIRMFDNPAFSKSFIDIAAQSGIKYGIHSQNPDRSPYHKKRQYDLFYMQGNEKQNKLLIFNGKSYGDNYGFGGTHWDTTGSPELAEENVLNIISHLESRTGDRGKQLSPYPYDKFPLLLIPYGDNKGPMEEPIQNANAVNKKWADQGYVYPHINADFAEKFFEDVEEEYGDIIPTETGTEENWWNDGWGTTAYESGVNKEAGSLVPVAETASSFMSLLTGKEYPVEDINEAVERNIIYDEHTWGAASYNGNKNYHDQFEWKRSNAFGAMALAEKIVQNAIDGLAKQVNTEGTSIYVYNPLNWTRDDVVTIKDTKAIPEHFVLKDGNQEIAYTRQDGEITFVAPSIPAFGYKTFLIEETTEDKKVNGKTTVNGNVIENDFYKVTFANDGTIASIIDKKNDNREIVDSEAEVGFNQYQYYDDYGVPFSNMGFPIHDNPDAWKKYSPTAAASNLVLEENELGATASLDTSTFRANSITQKVTLYDNLPRIDIENVVVKESTGSLQKKEEAFYTFPFKASEDYKISYDLPIGNVEEGSQVYGTSHDWYTASKWVSVKDGDYNMSIAIPNTSLVQFGERRTGAWSFDYVSKKPYIYSYVMNNMWQTNFQGDQPGAVSFKYSIMTGKENKFENTTHFGWEATTPLQAAFIEGKQQGTRGTSGSYISIDKENVQMTTMKSAESNGEGMILRLSEIEGKDCEVTVTLPFENVKAISQTDMIENTLEGTRKEGNTYTIKLPAYGTRTLRVHFEDSLDKVENVVAATSAEKEFGENLSLRATATADSEFRDGNYPAKNALAIDTSKQWATNGTKKGTLTMKWPEPIKASTVLIQDRPGGLDYLDSAKLTMKLNGTVTYEQNITGFRDDELKTLILDESVTLDELVLYVEGSDNVGVDGIELYGDKVEDASSLDGTKVSWDKVDGAWYYEVYRDNGKEARYIGYAEDTTYFDTQVTGNVTRTYSYKVRAVGKGTKGAFSNLVKAEKTGFTDTENPEKPVVRADVRDMGRIDLGWNPCKDDTMIDYYEIYRNGELIGTTRDDYIVTYRDRTAQRDTDYEYVVYAVDKSGKKTASDVVKASTKTENNIYLADLSVSMGVLSPEFNPDVKNYDLHLGNNFKRLKPVYVTAVSENENDVLTINGKEVASGSAVAVENLQNGDTIAVKVKGEEGFKVYIINVDDKDPIITAVDAKSGSAWEDKETAMNVFNGAGMSGNSLQDTTDNHGSAIGMWHTQGNPGEKAWIQVDLGKTYPLDEMWVWNINQKNNTQRGFKNVKIEYSEDGTTWNALSVPEGMTFTDGNEAYPFQFAQASGNEKQAATNLNDGKNTPVQFNGANARYVKITAAPTVGDGSWGAIYYGLSEVRFTSYIDLYPFVNVDSITVAPKDGAKPEIVRESGELTMEAKVLPANATETDVIWSVTDEEGNKTDVATISKDGILRARKNGTVKVVATANDSGAVQETCTIEISGQSTVIEGVSATAENSYDDNNHGPDNLVNNSGMSGKDSVADVHDDHQHGQTMWHTESNPKDKAVVTFDLGEVKEVADMWIWNINQLNNSERGLRNVKIEYRSSEEEEWQTLENVHQREDALEGYPFLFEKANGKGNQKATNLVGGEPVVFNRAVRYVRVSANPKIEVGSYGSEYFGLSEIRFTEVKEVDQALLEVVKEAEAKEEADYTATSWVAFEEVFTETMKVVNTAFASDEEVEKAAVALSEAMNALEEKPFVDKSALADLVDECKVYEQENYTEESWSVFASALAEAEVVLANADATQEEVNAIYVKLDTAIRKLVRKPADKTGLQKVYDELKDTKADAYTEESWKAFAEALEEARVVLGDVDATQETIDAVEKALIDAYEALEVKPTEPDVDKSDLGTLYDEYSKLEQGNFTDASWKQFQDALKEAEIVLNDDSATQKEVDLATGKLQNAYEALEENEDPTRPVDPENPDEPGDGGNTDSGNNNNGNVGTDTGDTSNAKGMTGLMGLAGFVLLGAVIVIKKRKTSK